MCLQNLTLKKVTIPAWCVVSQIQTANEVPGMYALVTPKGHLISGDTISENAEWLSPVSDIDRAEDLGSFPDDAEPKV